MPGPVTFITESQSFMYINKKISKFVPVDTDVTLYNINLRVGSLMHNLFINTMNGSYTIYGSCSYISSGAGWYQIKGDAPLIVTTEPVLLALYPNFQNGGDSATWHLMDINGTIAWRIHLIIGKNYINNFISIEQLDT